MAESPSGAVVLMSYTFVAFESLVGVTVLAIACLNLAVIGPTRLLHSNLKCILITQRVAVVIFSLNREAMLVEKVVSQQPFALSNIITQIIIDFIAIFRRMLGHALIIERFIATVYTNSYEHFSRVYFNLAWFSLTFIIATINCITNNYSWDVNPFVFATVTFSTLLSLAEYLMIIIIGYYNRRKYKNQIAQASAQNYHIELRFEISDKMNTAKQLSTTFLCLFLSNILMNTFLIVLALNIANDGYQNLAFSLCLCADQMLNAAIELTIITHHPVLRRRFGALLKNVFRFKRNQINNAPSVQNSVQMSANGRRQMYGDDDDAAVHFKRLQQQWNE